MPQNKGTFWVELFRISPKWATAFVLGTSLFGFAVGVAQDIVGSYVVSTRIEPESSGPVFCSPDPSTAECYMLMLKAANHQEDLVPLCYFPQENAVLPCQSRIKPKFFA